ncbi:MAG: DUF3344 domain-containing protein [Minicystis sp.]
MRNRHIVGALASAAILGLGAGDAAANPALRKQVVQHGDFVLLGNTLGQNCSVTTGAPVVGTVSNCPAGTTGTAGNGPDLFWESDFPAAGMATASPAVNKATARSTAVLNLPAGATVTAAYLYWSGRPDLTGGMPNPADAAVVLDRPGGGGFTSNVTALQSWYTTTGPGIPGLGTNYPGYQSVADITGIVQQNGAGAYRVAGVDSIDLTAHLSGNLAVGWWMAVIYQDSTSPIRQILLYDGFDSASIQTPFSFTFGGFFTPPAGYTARLGVVAWDGDAESTGDSLLFNNVTLTDALNPANNFFNGTRSYLGVPVSNAGDLPQLTGLPGSLSEIDIDVVDVTTILQPGDSSATVAVGSMGDVNWIGGIVTSIATLAPDFITSTKTVVDQTSGTTTASPGDILVYTITATNSGTDAAVNTVLTDPLPANVTYVAGSLQITGGPNAGNKTDAIGDDQAEYDAATKTIRVRLGTGANGTMGGSLGIGATTTFTFKVQVNAGATGSVANQAVVTAAGQLGTIPVDYVTDGNGPLPGSPPTSIPISSCPISSCACLVDADCGGPTSGTVCNNGAGGTFTCIPGCRGQGGNGCMPGLVCSSTTTTIGTCNTPPGCNTDADCSGGKWCNETAHACTDKLPNGTPIPNDPPHMGPTLNGTCTTAAATLVCVSAVCDASDNQCGHANGNGPCTVASGPTVCRSGVCSPNGGVCIPAGGCAVDSDCAADQWCNTPTFTCTPKIPNGQNVPTAAGHNPTLDGTCTAAAGAAVCVSGVCDVNDNQCGYANGDGPCNMVSGPIVCRSGVCGPNNVCVPAGGCNADSDCPSTDWCNVSMHACTPKLPNGTAIPSDPPHGTPTLDGTCTTAAGAAVCVSAVCDVNDNQCGYANGDGPCTSADGATVCRSTLCATTGANAGLCVECLASTDCPASAPACDPATNTCGGCTTDADCGNATSGKVCDDTTHMCIDGCHGTGGNGCPSGQTCTSTDTSIGQCVECASDADCGGPMSGKVCDDASHACVDGCRGMAGNGCPSGKICTSQDASIGMCVECTKDAECGGPMSGKVCDTTTSACIDGCRGDKGNGCKAGDVCTSTTIAIGSCMPGGTGGSGGGTGGGGTGGQNDGFVASGNGLICAAQPGPAGDGGAWLFGGLAGLLLAVRRRRR